MHGKQTCIENRHSIIYDNKDGGKNCFLLMNLIVFVDCGLLKNKKADKSFHIIAKLYYIHFKFSESICNLHLFQ